MALPFGWGQNEVDATIDLANRFGADPEDILALWNSESGLFYRCGLPNSGCIASVPGYFGLNQGYDAFMTPVIGRSWKELVSTGTVLDQIAAIKKFWASQEAGLGESTASRAARLGVIPSAVIYSNNFVPGYFKAMKTADQPMVVKDGGPDHGQYYRDNPGFDYPDPNTGLPKGYITVRDVERRILNKKQEGIASSRTRDLFLATMEQSENPYANVVLKYGTTKTPPSKTDWKTVLLGVALVGAATATGVYYVKRSRRVA